MDTIAGKEGAKEKEKKEHNKVLRLTEPNLWNLYRNDNLEVSTEKNYERLRLSVSEHTTEDMSKITVFRFYTLLDFIAQKNKKDG